MRSWALLMAAILSEVAGTIALRGAVDVTALVIVAVAAYLSAVVLMGLALRAGIPVGLAYGIWSAVGVAVTAVLGVVIFDEPLSVAATIGIGLIIVGVLVIESGARRRPARAAATGVVER